MNCWWMCCFLPMLTHFLFSSHPIPLTFPSTYHLALIFLSLSHTVHSQILPSFPSTLFPIIPSAPVLHPSLLLSSCSCSLRVELVLRPPLPQPWDPPLFPLNMLGTSTWPCPVYLALPTMSRPSPHLTTLNLPKRSRHTRAQMCPRRPKERSWYWAWGRGSYPLQRAWNRHHTLSRPETGRSLKGTIRLWWPLKTFQKQMESTSQRQPCQVEEFWQCVWLCFKLLLLLSFLLDLFLYMS